MAQTDLYSFAVLASDMAPAVECIDGLLFLDRGHLGLDALRARVATFSSPREAQSWINLVPIDDFIDCAVAEWSSSDSALMDLVDTYRRSWLSIVRAKFGDVPGVSVDLLIDDEVGDVVLRLSQNESVTVMLANNSLERSRDQ